jgi:hypothetical protein
MPPAAATGTGARYQIDDCRYDVDGGARRAVATGLAALRNQHVGAGIERLTRHRLVLYLADQESAGGFDARREWFWIAERQHDRAWLERERDIQQLGTLGEAPGDKADAERRGCGFELGGLLLQPRAVAIATAENAKASGGADGGGQPRAGNHVHRRRQDRMRDAQEGRQWRADRHVHSSAVWTDSLSRTIIL